MNPVEKLKDSSWMPIFLSALVLPGLGQLYRKQKVKGYLMAGLALTILLGAFARYMSVLFALANVRARNPRGEFQPFQLVYEAWMLDRRVLLAFLGGFAAVWILSVLDLVLNRRSHDSL
jgi:TM2 domain-containing membrane protein YozV